MRLFLLLAALLAFTALPCTAAVNAHAWDAPERAPMRCAAKAVGQGRIQYRNSASSRSGSTGLVR